MSPTATLSMERLLTVDDAIVAAEVLRELDAGHEGSAFALAAMGHVDDLTTTELETLCAVFGVEV